MFPSFSADFLLFKHFGIGGEVSWRATRNLSDNFAEFRPIFYDINAVYAPPLGKHAALEFVGGLGSTRLNPVEMIVLVLKSIQSVLIREFSL